MDILSKDQMKKILGGVVEDPGDNMCNVFCGETANNVQCSQDQICKHCSSMGGQKGSNGQTHVCSQHPDAPLD